MKIFIMGTLPNSHKDQEESFQEMCKNIALFLQKENHDIILAGTLKPNADYYIIKATTTVASSPKKP